MPSQDPHNTNPVEIRKLNTLRGVAALIVVFSHFANVSRGRLHDYLNDSGQIGVMIFFILSGFLMAALYLERQYTRQHVYAYVVARIGRVIPLYLLVVALSYLLFSRGLVGYFYHVADIRELLAHLLFLYGDSVLWTIPAEIIFYAFFLLLWWCFQRRTSYFYLACVLCFLGVIVGKFPRPRGDVFGLAFDIQFFRALPFFITGLLFGQLYRHWRPPAYLYRNVYVVLLLFIPLLYPKVFSALTGNRYLMWLNIEIVVMLAAVFFAIVFMIPDSNRLLSNRVGDFLGRISYSLYLLHLPLLVLVIHMDLKGTLVPLAVFLALTLLVCYLSYRLLENPLRLAIRGLAAGAPGKEAVEAS